VCACVYNIACLEGHASIELHSLNASELQTVLYQIQHAHELRKHDCLGRRILLRSAFSVSICTFVPVKQVNLYFCTSKASVLLKQVNLYFCTSKASTFVLLYCKASKFVPALACGPLFWCCCGTSKSTNLLTLLVQKCKYGTCTSSSSSSMRASILVLLRKSSIFSSRWIIEGTFTFASKVRQYWSFCTSKPSTLVLLKQGAGGSSMAPSPCDHLQRQYLCFSTRSKSICTFLC
jgi:hypothetical protein